MPEGLTQTKTPTSKKPAGFKSECWPISFRNRGRLQIGTVAGFKSEYPAGINRNPQAAEPQKSGGVLVAGTCTHLNLRFFPDIFAFAKQIAPAFYSGLFRSSA
jgi:hypothetical protein